MLTCKKRTLAAAAVLLLPGSNQPHNRQPHLESVSPFVMSKFFGVTPQQAQRVQALLRLGVTDDDVRVAERLFGSGSRSEGADKVTDLLSTLQSCLLTCTCLESLSRLYIWGVRYLT